jgi:hypothetical protein
MGGAIDVEVQGIIHETARLRRARASAAAKAEEAKVVLKAKAAGTR